MCQSLPVLPTLLYSTVPGICWKHAIVVCFLCVMYPFFYPQVGKIEGHYSMSELSCLQVFLYFVWEASAAATTQDCATPIVVQLNSIWIYILHI